MSYKIRILVATAFLNSRYPNSMANAENQTVPFMFYFFHLRGQRWTHFTDAPRRWSNCNISKRDKAVNRTIEICQVWRELRRWREIHVWIKKHSDEGLKWRGFWTIGSWKKGEIEIVLLWWWLIGPHTHITVGGKQVGQLAGHSWSTYNMFSPGKDEMTVSSTLK